MRPRCALAVLSVLALLPAARAQIEVRAKYEGEWLPIASASGEKVRILKDGKRKEAAPGELQVQPASEFGAGQVHIDNEVADLDPLKDAKPEVRARPDQVHFRYTAQVTGETDLEDCYAVLVFVSNGSVGTNLQPIGTLRRGQRRAVKVEVCNRVDFVSDLHVFSGAKEIRSNKVTAAYDARELWAKLTANARGVSAVELCKAEEELPLALSRDGKYLSTARDRGDHFGVVVYDMDTMAAVYEVAADKEYKRVTSLEWASPGLLAFVVDKELKVIDINQRVCTPLRKQVLRILNSADRKPEILALIIEGVRWWETLTITYDVKARRQVDWDELDAGWTQFDPNGEPRLRYKYDGANKEYYARIGTRSRWVLLDSTVKDEGLSFSIKGGGMLDRKAEVIALGQDGDTIYISSRLGSDTFKLAAYTMSEGRITRIIAAHPKYDLTDSDYNECRLLFHRATSEPVGMVFNGEKPKVVWFDPGYEAIQKALENQFPGQSVIPLEWSDDGGTFIYFVGSDRNPGEYYVFRTAGAKLAKLLERSSHLVAERLAKTTPMDFVARDGAKIHAYLTLPPQPTTAPMPLLVNIHGGPMVRDSWCFNSTNQFFATRGYAVLQVNYRGSSGYGAAYQAAGLRARLDTVILDDIADGVQAVIASTNIDRRRIAIMGGSFGGWATYMSLAKYPEIYRAGIAIAALAHIRDQQKDNRRNDNRYSYEVWNDILGRKDFDADERFIDPLLRASEIHQPVYIMHGELDLIVSPSQAGDMLKALKKTNPNVCSMSFVNAGHSYWPERDRVTQLNEIESFLRTYLAPEPASPDPAPVAAAPQK